MHDSGTLFLDESCNGREEDMNIHIRNAQAEDFKKLMKIYAQLDELHRLKHPELFKEPEGDYRPMEYIYRLINDSTKYLAVAVIDDEIAGFAEAFIMESANFPVLRKRQWIQLDNIAVSREYQGKGIGSLLLDSVLKWGAQMKIGRIELKVYDFNAEARNFYIKEGFKNISHNMYLDCYIKTDDVSIE